MEAAQTHQAVADDAPATILRQQEEIGRLKQRITEDRFAQDLRDAMTTATITGVIGAPVSYNGLLRMIVATAADIVKAKAAWLFLIDAEQRYLVSEVSVGDQPVQAAESGKIRIPLGEGIAGLVAQTGQPMALSETEDDQLDASDIGHQVGFNPKHILCSPLSFEDRMIGVLQFLDKEEDDEGFSVDDIEDVSLFAHLGAVAIEQSRTQSRMGALLAELVEGLDGIPDYDRHGLTERARAFTAELGQQTGYLDALDLARLVHEIVLNGDDATHACKGILENFVVFLRGLSDTSGGQGASSW
jgi:GAF domain-containing protein